MESSLWINVRRKRRERRDSLILPSLGLEIEKGENENTGSTIVKNLNLEDYLFLEWRPSFSLSLSLCPSFFSVTSPSVALALSFSLQTKRFHNSKLRNYLFYRLRVSEMREREREQKRPTKTQLKSGMLIVRAFPLIWKEFLAFYSQDRSRLLFTGPHSLR